MRMRRLRTWLGLVIALAVLLPAAAQAASAGNGAPQRADQALQHVKDLKQGLGVATGRELTPALLELHRTKGDLQAPPGRQADALPAPPTDGNADPQGDGYTTAEA